MPITIKSTGMKYKNPDTGVYQGVDMLEEATIRDVIVDAYSPTLPYAVGEYCLYNGELYCCTTAIPAGGEAWNLAHWEKTKVTDELEDIKGAVDSIGSDDVANESNVSGTTATAALNTLNGAINAIHKVYYSVTEMGLATSPKPTLASVANAMADETMAVLSMNEVDESEMTTNLGLVNVILIYRVSSVRTFAFGARSYGNVNYTNARIFYGAYNSLSWFGWKEFELAENSAGTVTASNITSGVSVTCRKKGSIVRLDCGIASGSTATFTKTNSGSQQTVYIATLPEEARPPANVYFPVLIRTSSTGGFDDVNMYAAVFTNGNIGINITQTITVYQMVLGQTYFTA